MALPANADVRSLLSRIRAGAEWGWKGGAPNDFTLVRWRDAVQIEPTEAEYAAEQVVVDAENATEATTRTAQRGRAVVLVGQASNGLNTTPELQSAVEQFLLLHEAIDIDGNIKPIAEWKN